MFLLPFFFRRQFHLLFFSLLRITWPCTPCLLQGSPALVTCLVFCVDPLCVVNSKLPSEFLGGVFGGSTNGEAILQGSQPVVRSPILVTGLFCRLPTQIPSECVITRCSAAPGPSEGEPPLPDGRFDAFAFRLVEGLGVRAAGGVVRTMLLLL